MSQARASEPSDPVVITPSLRLVRPFYSLSFVLIALVFFLVNNNPDWPSSIQWLAIIPIALFVWTLVRHMKLRFTRLTVAGNKLRYEQGIMSKSTRTLELSKVQDVGVTQTLTQRMLGIGDITVETAGDSAPLAMHNVDRPQAVADYILESARR